LQGENTGEKGKGPPFEKSGKSLKCLRINGRSTEGVEKSQTKGKGVNPIEVEEETSLPTKSAIYSTKFLWEGTAKTQRRSQRGGEVGGSTSYSKEVPFGGGKEKP